MKKLITSTFIRIRKTNILENFLNLSVIQISNAVSLLFIYALLADLIGLQAFGKVIFASAFCAVAGSIVNYGTNQSGIKDVAENATSNKLSKVFLTAISIRALLFIAYLLILFLLSFLELKYYQLILMSLPLVFAEVINPLFFFIGVEKLKFYNFLNLISKLLAIVAILLFVKSSGDAQWVNFIIGTASSLTFLYLLFQIVVKFKIKRNFPNVAELKFILVNNFYLTINNLSVQLQQSIMVFALGEWGREVVLGAYAFCDKILWGCRVLIIAVSNAIYPRAVTLYKESHAMWRAFRFRLKVMLTALFILGSLAMFFFPELIIQVLTGTSDPLAIKFIRAMAWAPTLAAVNSLNVLDMLIKNKNLVIFRISMVLLVISIVCTWIFAKEENLLGIAYYAVIVELSALIMYELAIKRYRNA